MQQQSASSPSVTGAAEKKLKSTRHHHATPRYHALHAQSNPFPLLAICINTARWTFYRDITITHDRDRSL
eukprot:45107-Eustigmatos_ZCMA.PRE.1